jgi:hypothetical protein
MPIPESVLKDALAARIPSAGGEAPPPATVEMIPEAFIFLMRRLSRSVK